MAAERKGITANGNEASFRGRESSDINDNQCAALIEYTKNHRFIYTLRVNLMVCAYINKAVF